MVRAGLKLGETARVTVFYGYIEEQNKQFKHIRSNGGKSFITVLINKIN